MRLHVLGWVLAFTVVGPSLYWFFQDLGRAIGWFFISGVGSLMLMLYVDAITRKSDSLSKRK